ncbi:4-hydroxy-tetrahydrodipicolinate synthase [Collibacillus ludicampi]|uniref:4-hydroxy-tetrahydrodipicolinate synthase n=1 Tax=Collibacillus ludicampi TaxID=2771369 RepID=A0AAV4LKA1_9BACL|nr:4-hydroxy-tetrahydrodipicolinate synthase [Collibacillus ludicampi]GIM47859.1 4-hydroxy-tetrahydrodipicolinate synthase [Collibacillus ludicampi]
MDFGRVLTAMVTPFDDSGEHIDWNRLEVLVEHLVATGTETLVVAGTTGESPTLAHEEKIELFRRVVELAKGRTKVIAGTGSNNTKATIALSKEAEECGVDGLLLVAPYYNKPSQEGLYQHFKTVAESVGLPCILYNIPGRTSINIEIETQLKLAEIPNIIGSKESSTIEQVSRLLAQAPRDFVVYSGDDKTLLPLLAVGGHGVISVASHVVGQPIKEMIDHFFAGRIHEAIGLHQRLLPIFEGLFLTTNPSLVKEALNHIGVPVGPVRLPLVAAEEPLKQKIHELLREWYPQK